VGVDHRVTLSIEGQSPHAAVLKDISGTGCFFTTSAPVEDGWAVRMSFRLRPSGMCEASGKIVRLASSGFGVHFDSINRMLHGVIVTLLAAPPSERSAILGEISEAVIAIGPAEAVRGS
jgi:hypothetical protein